MDRTRIAPLFAVVAGLVVLVVAGVLIWNRPAPAKKDLDLPPPKAAASSVARVIQAAQPEAPVAPPKPQEIEGLLGAISKAPAWAKWLAEGDAIRRGAVVLDNLAEGVSPRKVLPFLAPKDAFRAEMADGHLVPTERSQQRYDAFAETIASVDTKALAAAWRGLHPLLQATWRALGYPDGSLDARAAEALQRIVDAPAPMAVELIDAGRYFLFADPELESLGPVEKHLIRMGRRNQRLIQAKARDVIAALHLQLKAQR